MVTKEELEKSTFIARNGNVWFMTAWALMMFIIDGVVYAVDPPPGESKWGYGPTVFLMCLVSEAEDATREIDATPRARRENAVKRHVMTVPRRRVRGTRERERRTTRRMDATREIERGLRSANDARERRAAARDDGSDADD